MNQSKRAPKTLRAYFGHKALIVAIVLVIGLIAMLMSMKISNCSVLVGDAMSARADYLLTGSQESEEALDRFFTQEYIQSGALKEDRAKYENYNISNYIDLPSVEWIWVWPWSSNASVRVHDKVVSISGSPIEDELTDENGNPVSVAPVPPAWPTGDYAVRVKNVGGRWLIDEIVLLELDKKAAEK
ncbi:MAG: hypothetical protein E7328_03000 [Clostridiales bacterium]|nr:hypothetical protein [Clostridiales bacterium]